MNDKDNPVVVKSRNFAIRIVKLYKHLTNEKTEFVMSKQLLRSGTSVGANIAEAEHGQTEADFYAKMNIALKEIAETEYWLNLLHDTEFTSDIEHESIMIDCLELLRLLTAITKRQKIINGNFTK